MLDVLQHWSPLDCTTSNCDLNKNVLGDNSEAFEADRKAAFLAHDPSGHYRETMRFGYTIGRKST